MVTPSRILQSKTYMLHPFSVERQLERSEQRVVYGGSITFDERGVAGNHPSLSLPFHVPKEYSSDERFNLRCGCGLRWWFHWHRSKYPTWTRSPCFRSYISGYGGCRGVQRGWADPFNACAGSWVLPHIHRKSKNLQVPPEGGLRRGS